MADAVQLVLETDLSTSRDLLPVLANDDSGTYLMRANDVLRTTITQRNDRLYLDAVVTDNSTQKDRRTFELESGNASGILRLLNELAMRLNSGASRFSTNNNRALQAYTKAASSTKPQDRVDALNQAISIDPSFGVAYIALADIEAQTAPQALPSLLRAAAAHEPAFTPFDRVRMNALLAGYSHAPLLKQEAAYRGVLEVAPNDYDALVKAGSLAFLSGDAASGARYLQRALALSPGNPAIQRAFAEGLFEVRRFREAEKLLVGMDNNPAILPQLAICVLMEGDVARANAVADHFFASISNPDAKTIFGAVWLKLSGQSTRAINLLRTATVQQPGAQAVAYAELSMWEMMANNFAAARQWAAKAYQADPRPGSIGGLAVLLASADHPADGWERQVNSSFLASNEPQKQLALGYGFFLGGHYAEAAEVWSKVLQQSGGTDLRARAMLAGSLTRQGNVDEARRINVQPFVPEFGDLYASLSFFEMNRDLGIAVG
jgi:tetratricopeptide (TPR) repeat protein